MLGGAEEMAGFARYFCEAGLGKGCVREKALLKVPRFWGNKNGPYPGYFWYAYPSN